MFERREIRRMNLVLIIGLCLTPLCITRSVNGAGTLKDRAIIIVSTITNDTIEEQKAVVFHEFLLEKGYSEGDISFCAFEDTMGSDGISNVSNIEKAFIDLIEIQDTIDEMVIYISDHAQGILGNSSFSFIDGTIPTSTIDSWIENINCSGITIILNGNRSGLAGPELKGPDQMVMSSMMWNQTSYPDHFNITRGLNDPSSDIDGDGKISYEEAFKSECRKLISLGHPQVPEIWK